MSSEKESVEKKVYLIGGKNWILPTLKYLQYKMVNDLLAELKINVGEYFQGTEGNKIFSVGQLLTNMFNADALPKLLAILLTEEDKEWKRNFAQDNVPYMEEVDEEQVGELVGDFFTGRSPLISTISGFFMKWMRGNVKSTEDIKLSQESLRINPTNQGK